MITGSRKDRRISSVDKQYDHQEGFFFNRLITVFEPMALKLSDSWSRRRARPNHKSAWCFEVIFNEGSWVSIRSNKIEVEKRNPLKILLAALWKIFNWLVRHINFLQFLVTHSTNVLFFAVVISTRVCDSDSSSTTFSKTFIMAQFVVKPTLRSNKASKFKSSVKYHKRIANDNLR